MQHWILTSAQEFYANAKDILDKCQASFYIEVGDGKGGYSQILSPERMKVLSPQ